MGAHGFDGCGGDAHQSPQKSLSLHEVNRMHSGAETGTWREFEEVSPAGQRFERCFARRRPALSRVVIYVDLGIFESHVAVSSRSKRTRE